MIRHVAFAVSAAVLAAVCVAGCKTVPGADAVRTVARAGGSAAGLSLNFCDVGDEAGQALTNIVTRLKDVTPRTGETLEDAWTRTARAHTDVLVARGDLTPQQGAMVMAGFNLVMKGYDLLLVYHPEIVTCVELASAAVDGFVEGFLSSYDPERSERSGTVASGTAPDGRILEGIRNSREFMMLRK